MQELKVLLIAKGKLKVPCKKIETVALAGYISTIFGHIVGEPSQVAYYGSTVSLAPTTVHEAISMSKDDSKQCEHLLSEDIHTR